MTTDLHEVEEAVERTDRRGTYLTDLHDGDDLAYADKPGDSAALKALKIEWRNIAARERAETLERQRREKVAQSWWGQVAASRQRIEHLREDRARVENAIAAMRYGR